MLQREFAQQMEMMFVRDFARSREMTVEEVEDKSWWFRATSRAAYLTAPVL